MNEIECAYMLLVIIYVVCIYVGEIFYMLLVVNCWCKHVLEYILCGLVKLHEVCIVLSSPSSHTVGLVAFISMLVLNTYVFIIRGDMMFLLHQGRQPRR